MLAGNLNVINGKHVCCDIFALQECTRLENRLLGEMVLS